MDSLEEWRDTNYGYCGSYYYGGLCHIGSDLPAPVGTEVYPVSAGRIVHISGREDADCSSGWGWTTSPSGETTCNQAVIVEHYDADGNRFHALYGHVQRDDARAVGDLVFPDAPLGTVGDTEGGPHLHFGIFPDGYPTVGLGRTDCAGYPGTSIPAECSDNGSVPPMAFLGERLSVTPPEAPTLVGPVGGTTVGSPVTLEWTNGLGAYRVHVMVCGDETLSVDCIDPDADMVGVEPTVPFTTSYTVELAPGTYFWSVRGIGFLDFGRWGAYSEVWTVTVE
ncbi:MAG: M23 family metallopeptidase [Myxococcota bacterium]